MSHGGGAAAETYDVSQLGCVVMSSLQQIQAGLAGNFFPDEVISENLF
jgi:hypothetical protein